MDFKSYTKADTQVVADANTTVTDQIVDVLSAPVSFSTTELVTKQNRAVSVIAWGTIMLFGGELMGHYRARDGKQALVPFFRP